MSALRRASASAHEDRTRALVAGGLSVPGILTLVTLPAIAAWIPAELAPARDAEQRLFLLFFGLASLPFTLAAAGVALLRPPRSVGLHVLTWAAVALAALGAAYAFTG